MCGIRASLNLKLNLARCVQGPHLKLVADADEAELSGLLLDVFAVVGVFKQLADEAVLGLADETLQRHVQGVVVLLHKLGLRKRRRIENARFRPSPCVNICSLRPGSSMETSAPV